MAPALCMQQKGHCQMQSLFNIFIKSILCSLWKYPGLASEKRVERDISTISDTFIFVCSAFFTQFLFLLILCHLRHYLALLALFGCTFDRDACEIASGGEDPPNIVFIAKVSLQGPGGYWDQTNELHINMKIGMQRTSMRFIYRVWNLPIGWDV